MLRFLLLLILLIFNLISCSERYCLQKCCSENSFVFKKDSSTSARCELITNKTSQTHPELLSLQKERIVYDKLCNTSVHLPLGRFIGNYVLMPNGSINVTDLGWIYNVEEYCMDSLNGTPGVIICLKKEDHPQESERLHLVFGMIISMPFLLATFLVYAILPDRNLHQRALMFYVLSLLIAYVLLVTVNLNETYSAEWCKILGYSTLFFFLVSFFWMNVICFDIWYTFSGGRGFVGSKRTSERRRLIFYSIYAIGAPLLILAVVYLLQLYLVNKNFNPGIGDSKCFLADGWPNLFYFYGEAFVIVFANIVFFALTAFKIRQVKKETAMLKHNDSKRHNYEKDKQQYKLYLKLLFAMGANWIMEVISWLVNWQTNNQYQFVWWATDFFNALYGVFIFFIFVFKKKIWKLLQRRYYNFRGKPHLAHTMTSSNTRTSHYSSAADTTLTTTDRTSTTNGRTARPEELALRRVP